MPHLIGYAQMSIDNTITTTLVKAQCDFCGKKFGSVEEARRCENQHLQKEFWGKGEK